MMYRKVDRDSKSKLIAGVIVPGRGLGPILLFRENG